MEYEDHIREQLVNLLTVRQAHFVFDDVVRAFPLAHINTRPPGVPYSFWHLVEHLRITQLDILDYIRDPGYQYKKWPEEYWPDPSTDTDQAGWERSINSFRADLNELVRIITDPGTDLYAQIPHGEAGHTILREILVVGSHNAYHIGEMGILRGGMGLWAK
jgi:hypothetical protein